MSAVRPPLVPTRLEEVTAEWLTTVLSVRYPGVCVTRLTVGTVIWGTATKARLTLDYNEAGHHHRLPPTVWIKAGLEAHSQSADLLAVYAGEYGFFTEIADQLSIDKPYCYAALRDAESGACALVLEDLLARNALFGHASKPLDQNQAMALVAELARLHAGFWGKDVRGISRLAPGGALIAGGVIENLFDVANWEGCRAGVRGAGLIGLFDDRQFLSDKMMALLRFDAEHANTIVHGDPHLGNLFIDPERGPAFLDWQTVMHGFWAHDVAYALVTALSVDDRRAGERELIAHYGVTLADLGVTLDPQEAWDEYRRHLLYGVAWALCRPEWQPDEVCGVNAERALAAITDHQSHLLW